MPIVLRLVQTGGGPRLRNLQYQVPEVGVSGAAGLGVW